LRLVGWLIDPCLQGDFLIITRRLVSGVLKFSTATVRFVVAWAVCLAATITSFPPLATTKPPGFLRTTHR